MARFQVVSSKSDLVLLHSLPMRQKPKLLSTECLLHSCINIFTGQLLCTDYQNHCINIYDLETYEYVRTLGIKGDGECQFNAPTGIVCDSEGKVIVCDCKNNRVQILTADCGFMSQFNGSVDEDECRLDSPSFVNVDSADNIYVSDFKDRIVKFDQHGHFTRVLIESMDSETFVIHNDNIYTPDYKSINIHSSLNGSLLDVIKLDEVLSSSIWSIGPSNDGRILVSTVDRGRNQSRINVVNVTNHNILTYLWKGCANQILLVAPNTLLVSDDWNGNDHINFLPGIWPPLQVDGERGVLSLETLCYLVIGGSLRVGGVEGVGRLTGLPRELRDKLLRYTRGDGGSGGEQGRRRHHAPATSCSLL